MFTGLIQDVGQVERVEKAAGGASRMVVRTSKLPAADFAIGESVAVDGCCLTVVERGPGWFRVDASPETLARTTLGELGPGARVNLERALALGDRLGGHLVQGHVDARGKVLSRRTVGAFLELWIETPPVMESWLVEKGSVAVDGISLTVNALEEGRFALMLIPETLGATALGGKAAGASVNLEGDMIGKYVARLLARSLAGRGVAADGSREGLSLAFLEEHGFK